MPQSFRSNHAPNDRHEPHPWLEEKVYTKLRQRTVDLVKQSVDALCKDKQRVSLATVLIERLITTERTLAEQRERWLSQQDEVLTWRLRAEAAETQLQKSKEKPGV